MENEYILNSALEVTSGEPGRFRLRLPLWGRAIDATGYQIGLLHHFADWADPAGLAARFPFFGEESKRFIERCVAEGFLLPRGPGGTPALPARVLPSTTIFSAPLFDPARPPAFAFLGVPWDGATSGLPGARFGPGSLRQASSACRYQLSPLNFQPIGFHDYASGRRLLEGIPLADAGDVFLSPGESPNAFFRRVTGVVEELCRSGAVPVVMGGDHSITFAVLRAFSSRQHLAIVHLDAHTDLGDPSGGVLDHGNVFTHVLEEMENVKHLFQTGLRGLTAVPTRADAPRVVAVGIDQLRREGLQAFVDRLPDDLEYYLSVDIDVVDPAFAPATGTPVPGGLFPHELKDLLRAVASQRMVIGCDLVEVGQPQGLFDATAALGLECLLTVTDGTAEYARRVLAAARAGEESA